MSDDERDETPAEQLMRARDEDTSTGRPYIGRPYLIGNEADLEREAALLGEVRAIRQLLERLVAAVESKPAGE